MTQVQHLYNYEDKNIKKEESNRFETCEQIVLELIEEGIPTDFNPDSFILNISKKYNITIQEARSCVKMAIKHLESDSDNSETNHKHNENINYFWSSGYSNAKKFKPKNDGMDSLVSYASYNKLVFGIK